MEKLNVDQKYPELKYVNMANNYRENEYNYHILKIWSPRLKYGNWLFLYEVVVTGIFYKVYRAISAYNIVLIGNN